jgi:(p)ppGpp synthase/HD superfamily hydrolase
MPETTATPALLTERFQRALALASELHAAQVRKGTSVPYLAHLMSVAALVLEHGGGEDAAIGGLLHDAVEDSADGAASEARIRRELGERVGDIVLGCSDAIAVPGQPKPPWRERKAAYLERLPQENDLDVLLVSACDKLHNARTIVATRAPWDRRCGTASTRKTQPLNSGTTSHWPIATGVASHPPCLARWTR